MVKQPEALRLADWLEASKLPYDPADVGEAAAELRRLHEVEQELLAALEWAARALDKEHPAAIKARAVIAKVKGQQ